MLTENPQASYISIRHIYKNECVCIYAYVSYLLCFHVFVCVAIYECWNVHPLNFARSNFYETLRMNEWNVVPRRVLTPNLREK